MKKEEDGKALKKKEILKYFNISIIMRTNNLNKIK